MWKFLLLPIGVALAVAIVLFLLRKRTVAPWIWVPVAVWSAWGGLSLLPTAMPRDPRYGPPEWNLFGYDAMFVLTVLTFSGVVVVGALIGFPRRSAWRLKTWVGGLLVALGLPVGAWLLFTNPYSLQLIAPEGKPLAGVKILALR